MWNFLIEKKCVVHWSHLAKRNLSDTKQCEPEQQHWKSKIFLPLLSHLGHLFIRQWQRFFQREVGEAKIKLQQLSSHHRLQHYGGGRVETPTWRSEQRTASVEASWAVNAFSGSRLGDTLLTWTHISGWRNINAPCDIGSQGFTFAQLAAQHWLMFDPACPKEMNQMEAECTHVFIYSVLGRVPISICRCLGVYMYCMFKLMWLCVHIIY